MSGILGTAISGLMAFQRSLDTTSHNIANVNTEGYSRQRTELSTMPAQFSGAGGYMGAGVQVTDITRSYDQFISAQLRSSASGFGEADKLQSMARQVDFIVADDDSGLASSLSAFFKSVNDVAGDPTSIPIRQVMLGEADSLANHFNMMAGQLDSLRNQVNVDMQSMVNEINLLASGIADLNKRIASDIGQSSGSSMPNDLLDGRDLMLQKLAKLTNVSAVDQQDGTVSVFIGQGQSLVLGMNVSPVSLKPSNSEPERQQVFIGDQNVSKFITGGELAGVMRFRDEILNPAQQQLGLVAAGLSVQFNALHKQGSDLNGDGGLDLFSMGTPEITVIGDDTFPGGGAVSAVFDPATINQLQASDYRLDYIGGSYSLKRLSDNVNIPISGTFPETVGGIEIDVTTAPTGDASFLIRPTYNAAKNINTEIKDPALIAAAEQVPPGGTALPGDNRNALKLADLESGAFMTGGRSLTQTYGQLVSQIGVAAHSANVSRSAQEILFNRANQARENLAGVNLDEEAANLIKYQNSYQAAAQAVNVARTVFDTMLNAFR
ncbi:flagellar hook-associated protein FlgK [Methylotuvimicrobium sp. KM2]|uniref:flagellar hook-associated protein FlgK n=1 Tax=Methylotuvimicrobium sp. KM2 TaxID=3133976 RepID=UPI00310190EF